MPGAKTISVSYRVSARFKQLLEAAADRDRRSQTNMLEHLLFEYCESHGIQPDDEGSNAIESVQEVTK
ncbi:hypothetical protein [Cupriavidus sp. D384]|uniref:hypothetical protein n=1 Tax=Cupriavidus sp. D384 TaxID=1538095 RepID=UPI0008301ED0|nr:hypothetical protein [Cupriavidus sp. D384]